MIELKQTNKNLSLSNKQYLKGDDGGYYIPAIDAEGNLTWMPTVEDMPIPDAANIRGPIGITGAPGKDGRDGINGKDGKDGANGKDGYTPIKGVDYFDGAPGKDGAQGPAGKDGKDGKDGEPGPEGKPGEPGMTGATGPEGPQGPAGPAGKDGKDGEDYVLTDADKAEIAGMIEVPGGGDVDLSDYYTKEEIDELLANLPSGGGDLPAAEGVEF